jgi:hypothetical protein
MYHGKLLGMSGSQRSRIMRGRCSSGRTVTSDMPSLWRPFAMRTSRLDTLAVFKTLITIYWRDSDNQCSCNYPM